MSLYPVSNYNIGTGEANEVLDTISSPDGSLVVTFINGVAYFVNPITGSITNIDVTSETTTNETDLLTFIKGSAGVSKVLYADVSLNYNPSTKVLSSNNISISSTVKIGGINTITYNPINTRTIFSGGTGILVDSGILIGNNYSSNTIVGITGICNTGTTNFFEIYDNTIVNILFQMNSLRTRTSLPVYIGTTDGYTGVPLACLNNTLLDNTFNNIQLGFSSTNYNSWFIGSRYNTSSASTILSLAPYGVSQTGCWYVDGIGSTNQVGTATMLNLEIEGGGIILNDQTSAFAYLIESIANQFTITFNQTPTTPLTLNSFGQLILDGTQARLRLNSSTSGSADYYYSTVSGATTLATYNLFYFDGTTTINPLRLNTNGTLDLGTVAGSATGINLFGAGTSFLDCANASKGNLEFFMSGDVRLTAGGVSPALLNISTLGVLSFTGASATLTLTGSGATGGTINLAGVGTSSINCTDANKGQLDFLITNDVLITAGGSSPADLELTNLGILTLSRSGTGNCSLQFGGIGTNTISCNNTAKGAISFAMSNTVTITAGGSSPGTISLTNAGLLTVSGQVVCDAFRVTASSTGIGISLVSVNLIAQNSNTSFGSGNYCYVAPSGNTWIAVSDKRIKHDIQPLENCLEKILLLNPVNYKMNYDNKQCVGFIAQEVLEIIPELVIVPEDPESLLGVDLTNMTSFLVKAIQEQNILIKNLYLELEKLKLKLN